jgi:hypothetical protein
MADDSELDYIITFIGKVNTAHTPKSIETTKNINLIDDTQSVLIYAGETLSSTSYSIMRQYHLQYKDATEGALNASIYALIEGIRKLNTRETITAYTKPTSLIGMQFISSGKDYKNHLSGNWYANIIITAEWLTT